MQLSTYNFYKRNKADTMHIVIGGNGSVEGVRSLGKFIYMGPCIVIIF